ncbi:MAG TPA: hypothetical protein VMZ31_17055 [Phycisphaerae bacterium]|nr:hypothetical protein [Phycisphaerae bacterium]
MSLRVDCPYCGQWIVLPLWAAGRRARCLRCQGTFRVQFDPSKLPGHPRRAKLPDPPAHTQQTPTADEDEILGVLLSEQEIPTEQLESLRDELDQLFLAEAIPESTDLGDTSLGLVDSPTSNGDENPLAEYTDRLQAERRKLLRQLGVEAHEQMLPRSCIGLQAAIKEAQKQIEHIEARLAQLYEMAEASYGVEQKAAAMGTIHTCRQQLELLRERLDRRYRRLGRVIVETPELSGVAPATCRQLRRIQERIEALITPPGRDRSVRSPFRRHKQT